MNHNSTTQSTYGQLQHVIKWAFETCSTLKLVSWAPNSSVSLGNTSYTNKHNIYIIHTTNFNK